jgi:5-methylcytosine-specific restriction endonuclease McrA
MVLKKYRKQEKIRVKIRNNKFILDYKNNNKCLLCDWNKFTQILQFHHINSKNKKHEINKLKIQGTLTQLKEEISKCVLLCPNCHLEFHFIYGVFDFPMITRNL